MGTLWVSSLRPIFISATKMVGPGVYDELAASPAELDYRLAQIDVRAGELNRAEATLDAVLAAPATARDARFHAQVL